MNPRFYFLQGATAIIPPDRDQFREDGQNLPPKIGAEAARSGFAAGTVAAFCHRLEPTPFM